jgi:hypothetical protein
MSPPLRRSSEQVQLRRQHRGSSLGINYTLLPWCASDLRIPNSVLCRRCRPMLQSDLTGCATPIKRVKDYIPKSTTGQYTRFDERLRKCCEVGAFVPRRSTSACLLLGSLLRRLFFRRPLDRARVAVGGVLCRDLHSPCSGGSELQRALGEMFVSCLRSLILGLGGHSQPSVMPLPPYASDERRLV